MKADTKKVSRAAAIVAMLGLMAGLLAGCTSGSGNGNDAAPVTLGGYENAIQVTPSLDKERAITQTVGFAGGTISATAADGSVFTLTIPANSLRQASQITMTPLTKLAGLPFGNGTEVTVDLQPSGLVFDVPALLTIEPANPIPAGEQILYAYSDNQLAFAEPKLDSDGIAIVVTHFSGYGAAKGFMGDVEEVRRRIGGSAEQRIGSEIRAAMQAARQAALRGGPAPDLNQLLDPYFEQFEREVIKPRLSAAGQSCAAGRAAITTLFEYERQRGLLGFEQNNSLEDRTDLLQGAVTKCMDEEYEMCAQQHVVHRMPIAFLGSMRQLALLGMDTPELEARMKRQVEGCLHFDL